MYFVRWVGGGRISEIFYTKNLASDFFYKESKSNQKKILAVGMGGGGVVARVSDFFFIFSNECKSEKKKLFSF